MKLATERIPKGYNPGSLLADSIRRAGVALIDPDDTHVKLTEDQLVESRKQYIISQVRDAARNGNILRWGKLLFPSKFKLAYCEELHGYFVQIRKELFSNTEAPRGYAKTAIKCFLIPIFQALNESTEFIHYLNVQATEDKALDVNRAIKLELETNDLLLSVYGSQYGERWTDGQFVLKSGVVFTALGAGQSIRGKNYRNVRPDYVIVDDLYNFEDINNPDSTIKKNEWFWGDLFPAMSESKRTSMHVQGTAINKEDLLEELKGKPSVKSKTFRAVKSFDHKEVLWPELKNFDEVMAQKAQMPETIWYREKQNQRKDDATSIVKEAWMNNWEYEPVELERQLRKRELVLAGIRIGNDPSIGKKSESDFTGTAKVVVTQWPDGEGQDFWIEDLRNEKLGMQARLNQLKEIKNACLKLRPVTDVRIESIAGFNDYADEAIRTTNLPITRVDRVPDKITNLEVRSHFFQNGKVHINRNLSKEIRDMLKHQLCTNHPKHDDLRDAVLLTMDLDQDQWGGFGKK